MNRLYLKQNARESLTGRKPNPILVAFLYILISNGINLVVNTDEISQSVISGNWAISPPRIAIIGAALLLVNLFVSIITYGWYKYALQVSRGQEAGIGTLFDGVQMAGKVVALTVVKSVRIFLWGLLLFIPAIIKTYAYSQAENLLVDHPDWSVGQILRASEDLMRGHKMELFMLEISFIGWMIGALLTMGILNLWLNPYMSVTFANFYNQLISYTAPVAMEEDMPQDDGPSVEDYWKN